MTRRARNLATERRAQLVARCDAALTAYGSQRLEPRGWRELGVGSLPASSPGFRYFALEPAVDWATYEQRDQFGQTVADLACRQPHWFAEGLFETIEALGRSGLDLYEVDPQHGGPQTVLRRWVDDSRWAVDGQVRPHVVLPAGTPVVARLVLTGSKILLLSSAAIDRGAALAALEDRAPEAWSRQLLDVVLKQFMGLEVEERGSLLEPQLTGRSLAEVARLDRAMTSLERVLSRDGLWRHRVSAGELVSERRRNLWRISLVGRGTARAERLPVGAAHPLDVEVMRQIGSECEHVLQMHGSADLLATACAEVAVSSAGRRVA